MFGKIARSNHGHRPGRRRDYFYTFPGPIGDGMLDHMWGDVDTPVQDDAGVLINDCRVHDRLTFTVPEDLPTALYAIHVVVPNITGISSLGPELASDQEYINVIPPATARFEIVIEAITCKEETSPEWLGSDELGMHTLAAAVDLNFDLIELPDLADLGDPSKRAQGQRRSFEERNLDSGDT